MAKRKPYRYVLYLLARLVAGFVFLLPRWAAVGLGRLLGRGAYAVVARHRSRALENLRFAYGEEKTEAELRSIARKVFENLLLTAVEGLQFPKMTARKAERLVETGEAFQVYDQLLAEGRGLISVTAHIGNWELLAGVFGLKGYKGAVLARRIYYQPYNDFIVGLRHSIAVPTIYRDESAKQIFERLGRGEIIGLLPDQDIDSLKGIFVPFFGRPAYTTVGPARLALASGAPILPNFLIRTPQGYRLVLGRVIRPLENDSREQAVEKITADWMAQFEDVIRRYPDQWAWMHNRWKTKPATDVTPVVTVAGVA